MSFINDRFIKACFQEPVDTTPVWIMRQAGRYLPEYLQTRAQAGSFLKLCKTPELACEVTLQPLRRYNLDASIIFSDILTIPDAMNLGLYFGEGEGPMFSNPARTEHDIRALHVPDLDHLNYVYDAIKMVNHELDQRIPLIGFCGSPWTLSCYVIEGRGKNGFPLIHKMREENPLLLHELLDVMAKSVTAHLNAQIEAGAAAVMIFDTWGGQLRTQDYEEFSLFYVKQIISGLSRNYNQKRIPVILFTKGGKHWIETMAQSGCDVIGVDWEIALSEARVRAAGKTALQGNMNPEILLQDPAVIRSEVGEILASYGQGSGHIFNLGHGITKDVPPEHVAVLVDTVHELSQAYHR
ncbi:MAG TPA: uroporphyrinogen decarboxylase [Gammaproteobacteria bacterium]|jgi:uroporphyrinogen decarboxylase|nr:uroporphyrinogen decarboxylase [Gammaproteobacteria bacterium]